MCPQERVPGLESAPARQLISHEPIEGYVGEVLSTTLSGSGMGWGPAVEPFNAYLNDKKNGATMLSIALGHAADALCHCVGEVRELSATMTVRRKTFTVAETGESKPMTADDQVAVSGLLMGGAAVSIHYRGGSSRGTNLLWEINGSEGDLQLTATGGQAQIWEMDLPGGKGRAVLARDPARAGARRGKAQALPPTSPRRTRVSPGTIARERISTRL